VSTAPALRALRTALRRRAEGREHVSKSWSGRAQSGSREYSDMERARVVRQIRERHAGEQNATDLADVSRTTGLEVRTVRAILADADGIEFVLAYEDNGRLYAAEYQEQAERHTRVLRARAKSELDRVERREQGAAGLPRRQEMLM